MSSADDLPALCRAVAADPPDLLALAPLLDLLEERKDLRWLELSVGVGLLLSRKVGNGFLAGLGEFLKAFRVTFWAELEDGGTAGGVRRLADTVAGLVASGAPHSRDVYDIDLSAPK